MEENIKLNENLMLDLTAFKNFVFEETNASEKTQDNEITENYALNDETNKLELVSKICHEVKGRDFDNKETIRYDMLKNFLAILVDIEMDNSLTPMTLGQRIVLNTMIEYGLIKEINTTNNNG